MKAIIGIVLMLGGVSLAVWLSFWVMLYGGIMQAINNWGGETSLVVWGIIRAVFFTTGTIPGGIILVIGMVLCGADTRRLRLGR